MSDFADYSGFSPLDYLRAYYSDLASESEGLLRFLTSVFSEVTYPPLVLEFGSGPALISAIPAARKARAIHYCDFVPENRDYISRWLAGDVSEFDWTPYVARCLELEGSEATPLLVSRRMEKIRDLVTRVVHCDIFRGIPVLTRCKYEVIVSNYCLDAVTSSKYEWQILIERLAGLLKPGGILVLSSLRRTQYYEFGTTRYANVSLDESDLQVALSAAGFEPHSIRVETAAPDNPAREYQGVIFAAATLPLQINNPIWNKSYDSRYEHYVDAD